jgi:hypothetical protein
MSNVVASVVQAAQGPKPDPPGKDRNPVQSRAKTVRHRLGCPVCKRSKWLDKSALEAPCWGKDCSGTMTPWPTCSGATKAGLGCRVQVDPAQPGGRCDHHQEKTAGAGVATAPAAVDSSGPDGSAPAAVASLDDARDELPGLSRSESIAHTYLFDGSVWHLLTGQHQGSGPRWQRTVKRIVKKTADGEAVTLMPIIHGRVTCTARRSVVSIDPKSRKMNAGQESSAYNISYLDENGIAVSSSVVQSVELNYENKERRFGFLDRLGLCELVEVRKYDHVRDLIKAVIFDTRHTAPTLKVIDRAGIVYIDGALCYANATGNVIGPDGRVLEDVVCSPGGSQNVYQDIGYLTPADITARESLAGLHALAELLDGYQDNGVSGIGLGSLIASLMSGTKLPTGAPVGALPTFVGDTKSGKTSFVMLLVTSETRTVFGEVPPPFAASIAPNNGSGGATARGIYESMKHYGGCLAIMDDVIKSYWPTVDKERAHNRIINQAGGYVLGGGVAQAAPDKANGGVKAAEAFNLPMSLFFTMEEVGGIIGTMLDDSAYNRMAFAWWDITKRCDRKMYQRLSSQRHTLLRNTGLSYLLGILLAEPGILADGYELALAYLKKRLTDERVAKSYARCLMGLHVLDIGLARLGQPGTILADVLPGALGQAQALEAWGTHGGDQKAASDPVEAVRELLAGLLAERSVYGSAPTDPADRGKALVPQPPMDLPVGTGCDTAGWAAEGYGEAGATWKPRGLHIGEIIPRNPKGRPARFAYRLEMTPFQFMALVDKLNEAATRKHYVRVSRDQLIERLTDAGVLNYIRSNGMTYQLDWEWVISRGEDN